jgi:hypothetical protein
MPTYKVTDPSTGRTVKLTGDSPPTEQELEEIFASLPASEQPKEKGFLASVGEAITGSDRMTPEMDQLEPIGNAPELNAFSTDALKASAVGLFGSDESMAKVLQGMGGKITSDAKGNQIVELPSGRYALNKPGLSPSDVASGIAKTGSFALAGGAAPATIAGQALAGGGASLAMQGGVQAAGGEDVDPQAVGMDALLGGAGQAISNTIGAGYRALTGSADKLDDTARSAVNFAKEQDLPLMTTDVIEPKTFAGRSAQSLGEKIPIAGTGGAREAQQTARIDQIKKLAADYGVPNDEEIAKSVMRSTDKIKKAAGQRYDEIKAYMGVQPIPLNKTVQTIDDQIAKYTQAGAVSDPKVINALNNFKQQITAGDNNLELLRQNRTLFRELIKGDDVVLSDTAKRINDKVYRAMTDDMLSGVESKMGAQARTKLAEADSIYAREVNQIKNTKLKNILSKGDVKPEEATKMLFSADKSEFETLYRSLDKAGRDNARAAVVNKAITAFDTTDSPEKFLSAMDKLKPQVGVFFKGQERKQLDGLINYLDHTRQASKASTLTNSGQQLFQVVPAAGAADVLSTGGVGLAATGTIGAMARIYESKPVRDILIRMSTVPKGSTQFERLSAELNRLITSGAQAQND